MNIKKLTFLLALTLTSSHYLCSANPGGADDAQGSMPSSKQKAPSQKLTTLEAFDAAVKNLQPKSQQTYDAILKDLHALLPETQQKVSDDLNLLNTHGINKLTMLYSLFPNKDALEVLKHFQTLEQNPTQDLYLTLNKKLLEALVKKYSGDAASSSALASASSSAS